MQNWLESVA